MSLSVLPNPKALHEHLQADLTACEQLLAILLAECESLKQREHQKLEQLNLDKAPLLIELERKAICRQHWLEAYQQLHPNANWSDFLDQSGGQFLSDIWGKLIEAFNNCQHQNQINGKMVARSRQSVNRLLDIVRGLSDAPKLYTSGGNTKVHLSQRAFVKA